MDLKGLRTALDISQVELDRRANLPRGTTGDIESGRNQNPSVAVCLALVRTLRSAGAKGATVESVFATERETTVGQA